MVTVLPATVHTGAVLDANVTVSPELAVALSANGAVLTAIFGSAANVIVWPVNTEKLCGADANANVELPN